MSGGQQVDVFERRDRRGRVYSHFYWTTPTATVDNAPTSPLVASPEHEITTVYLQDRWQALPEPDAQPRRALGPPGDHRRLGQQGRSTSTTTTRRASASSGTPRRRHAAKVFGSYGRYYEQIPMDLVIRSFSFERQARIFNYGPTGTAPDPAAEADLERDSAILGGFTEPADPNLENQYIDEYPRRLRARGDARRGGRGQGRSTATTAR